MILVSHKLGVSAKRTRKETKMKRLVVIRVYPEAYLEKPGVEEIVGEALMDNPQYLVEYVHRNCRNDPGCCGYHIAEIEGA